MNPEEFLTVADTLCDSNERAYLRSAISRAYYASFLIARDYVKNIMKKSMSTDRSIHKQVKNHLVNSANGELNLLGIVLGELQDYRLTADYEMNDATPEKQTLAGDVCNRARRFIEDISKIRRSATP